MAKLKNRTAAEIRAAERYCKALEKKNAKKLEAGWTYAPKEEPKGFMEEPLAPFRWTAPPKKAKQPRKKKTEPARNSNDSQPMIDFGS